MQNNEPIATFSADGNTKTWNRNSPAMKAAIAVYRDADKVHPINADTSGTFDKARKAAEAAGAGYADASNLAVVAWDVFMND